MSIVATSVTRAADQAAPSVDQRVHHQTQANVAYYAARPDEIDERLQELDSEWDLERLLELNSALISLVGILLGIRGRRGFLLLPLAVQGFFMQHAIHGWCPPVPILRRLGVRTPAEIDSERLALQKLRTSDRRSPEAGGRRSS
jgi:hypothetical protein